MGFFSWITQDTKVSIPNVHSSQLPLAEVTMTDNKGNKWTETDYNGYGIFGTKDYYELVAEMNGRKTRDEGIRIALGIGGVMRLADHHIILGSDVHFFNWSEDIIAEGKSANQLLQTDGWVMIKVKEPNAVFPNLNEDPNIDWVDSKPKDCPYQGFFY